MERLTILDTAIAPLWLAVNFLLARFVAQLGSLAAPCADMSDRIVFNLVTAISLIMFSSVLLTLVGALSGVGLLLLVGIISAFGLYSVKTRARLSKLDQLHSNTLTTNGANSFWGKVPHWIWVSMLMLLLSHSVVDGLFRFPEDWDSLMYHMPMIDEWIQARGLYSRHSAYWWQPGISELVGFWIVAPFSGDFLIGLNNVPFAVLWAAATWSIARSLGFPSSWRHLASLAVLMVHTSIHETDDASNDLAVVAFWSAALALGLNYCRNELRSEAIVCGAAIGLLSGVKYFALGYAGIVLLAVIIAISLNRGIVHGLLATRLLMVPMISVGAFWYVRNFFISGSPVFPLGLTGPTSSLGYHDVFQTTFLGNRDPSRFSIASDIFWQFTGPCHVASVLLAPLGLIHLVFSRIKQRDGTPSHCARGERLLCAIALAGSFAMLVITPMLVEDAPGTLNHLRMGYTPIRFSLCFLSISVLISIELVVGMLRHLHSRNQTFGARCHLMATSVCAAAILWQGISQLREVRGTCDVTATLLLASNSIVLIALIKLLRAIRVANAFGLHRRLTLLVFTIALTMGISFLSQRWHSGYARHFRDFFGTTLFQSLSDDFPNDNRICVLDLRIYPFFGSARETNVCRPRYIESAEWLKHYMLVNELTLLIVHDPSGMAWDMYDPMSSELLAPQARFKWISTHSHHRVFRVAVLETDEALR